MGDDSTPEPLKIIHLTDEKERDGRKEQRKIATGRGIKCEE